MLKRKYGERSDWNRILERNYAQTFLDTNDFNGYITLLHTIRVSKPLFVNYGGKDICIVDDGYMWLQQFPSEKNHAVTTMFDQKGRIVQWYIDICLCNGTNDGSPWMDDLFLDIILLPSGEIIEKDADELEDALVKGIVDKPLYEMVLKEAEILTYLLHTGDFDLVKLSVEHKDILTDLLR